jgi:hypothetical protein
MQITSRSLIIALDILSLNKLFVLFCACVKLQIKEFLRHDGPLKETADTLVAHGLSSDILQTL